MKPVEARGEQRIQEYAKRMAEQANTFNCLVFGEWNDGEMIARPGDSGQAVVWAYYRQHVEGRPTTPEGWKGYPYEPEEAQRLLDLLDKSSRTFNEETEMEELIRLIAKTALQLRFSNELVPT